MFDVLSEGVREAKKAAGQVLRRPKLWLALLALSVIPILNLAVLGYFARVAVEQSNGIPTLRPLGRSLILGLKVLASALVYTLIALLLAVPMLFALVLVLVPATTIPIYSEYAVLGIILAAVALTGIVFVVLGVPIALILAAKRGVAASLNPVNSWRIIRRVGVGEYLAFALATLLAGALSLLPLPLLIIVAIFTPPIEVFLWRWGGLMVARAEAGGLPAQ